MKEKIKFYDTNEILHNDIEKIDGKIFVSSITLQEIEHIKTSRSKDDEVKFNARVATRWFRENEDKYECVVVGTKHHELLKEKELDEDNDNLIIACAYLLQDEYDVTFMTGDMCCYNIAKNIFDMKCDSLKYSKNEKYTGYKEIIMNDEEMAKFYETENKENVYGLLTNEYLIIKNSLNQPVDAWKFDGTCLVPLDIKPIKSALLGRLKEKDFYQRCALDSFQNNKITVIKGKPGSGKSHLSMNFLFSQIEKGKIDKIIIFTNPTPTRGAAEIGFLPGTRIEKLMESNIGNFLMGKIGDKMMAMSLITQGKLDLLPISDIRGFDTTGMNCAVYITEAQNMTVDMMKLSLQRIGDDCTCIIDGDCETQVDNKLYEGKNNGMNRLSEVFRDRKIYGEIELKNIYRSEIAKIADLM